MLTVHLPHCVLRIFFSQQVNNSNFGKRPFWFKAKINLILREEKYEGHTAISQNIADQKTVKNTVIFFILH